METSDQALVAYGWSDRWAALFADAAPAVERAHGRPTVPARVARHDGVAVLLATAAGLTSLPVRGKVDPAPVVGDWVVADDQAVAAILPRASLLRRQDPAREVEQPLVANLDAVFITCGLDRPVKPGRIRRGVALAWDAGAVPVVILTKSDLCSESGLDAAAMADEVAAAQPGVDVLVTSAVDGTGLDELRTRIAGQTVVLLGESGAGKSTLTNALLGTDAAEIGQVRRSDAKGRHTTTSRQLHPLPGGGVLVDTPGLRAVGLWIDEDVVAEHMDDVESLAETCRFSDCTHSGEPGCAVAAAIESGELPAERFETWLALQREAEAAARRAEPHVQRRHERRFARVVKDAQRLKGRDPDDG